MKKYSQRDPRWNKTLLGYSRTSTIGLYGCKITCFASWNDERPDILNEQFKKDGCFFNGDLLSDEACAKSLGWKYKGKETVNPNRKCLAEVDFSPAPGVQQHFVIYDPSNKRIFDPWTGDYRPESAYKFISYRVFTIPKESVSSSKTTPKTNETDEVVPTPIFTPEEAEKLKITQTYDIGEKPAVIGTGNTSEPPIETVYVGDGVARTETKDDPNVWVYTSKPLDLPTQSRLERIVNWCLEKWDKYRDSLIKR